MSTGAAAIADPSRSKANAPVALVLLALAVGGFAIGTTEFAAMSLLPYFSHDFGISAPTAGHAISAYALGVVCGAPTLAVLSARVPRRTLLIALMGLFAIGNGLSAMAGSFGWLVAFRFLSGLPHGAYFGVAALVAASLVDPRRRAKAVATMMTGLTVATIIGVPAATAIGQWLGWRWGFGIVAVLAGAAAIAVWRTVAPDPAPAGSSPLKEFGALKRPQVWLTLATGAIGFGGIFAVYTYLASTLHAVTGVGPFVIPLVLAVFGVGMTIGTWVCAWAADRALMVSAAITLVWSMIALALYPHSIGSVWTIAPVVFMIGAGGGLATILQTRLMDVSGDAQTLAAALNHSAFNAANALGPWLGGLAIAAGYGWASVGWVGLALAACGLAIWSVAWAIDRRTNGRARAA